MTWGLSLFFTAEWWCVGVDAALTAFGGLRLLLIFSFAALFVTANCGVWVTPWFCSGACLVLGAATIFETTGSPPTAWALKTQGQ